jgi:hypothetical protein
LTPDCRVHLFDRSAGYNHLMTQNVEIVEWDEHRSDLIEVIAQKCIRAYPKYFFLLVLARNGKQIDVKELLRLTKELRMPFAENSILGRLSDQSTEYGMFMLHPYTKLVEFDLAKSIRKNNAQIDFLQRQKRGKSTEMQDLGMMYPIP